MWLWFAGEGVTTFALVTSCLSPAVYKACFVRGKECENHEFLSEPFAEEEELLTQLQTLEGVCVCVCVAILSSERWGATVIFQERPGHF